ncbi:glycoside hydrolase family 2 TIM barrel-domain containing protein [Galbitalea sp. SE-J8]|uniref:glycoside hydrolase family 2 protein n=1 Tax=Galbitalea sp. SE-J8 TaxID=3054952 RepID=UPI00259CA29C|nr:glycoside hydrolase family 2 TIM barrel-domain containing protein [Galbitalea sp. SE-J8]MDM4761662.1 glycoside hydrolase family 2 TIM barrel-domain containing protein [Galbitalea sp. SE-J8]
MIRGSTQDGSYPRPLLVREEWTSLDGEWEFAWDDGQVGLAERWYAPDGAVFDRRIRVPFAPESTLSGIGDNTPHDVLWYRREVDLELQSGRRWILHLGAVDQSADVWVDGVHVGGHVGGQTSFRLDITDALAGRRGHQIVVRAVDLVDDVDIPRGKQDWRGDPHFIWYRRTSGIWKTVWLESVPVQHVTALHWGADLVAGRISASVSLALRPLPGTEVSVRIWHDGRLLGETRVLADHTDVEIELRPSALQNAQERESLLWQPGNPVLLDAEIVVTEQGARGDEVASYLGLRSTEVRGGRFLVNGRPIFVRSVLEQGFWPDGQLTAPDIDALRREVEMILELGFSAARIHQKVEDARMLFWADRLGLMIWAETASAYRFSPRAAAAITREWLEIVDQQRDHPSVVTWVPVNESWGVQDIAYDPAQRELVQSLASLTRALDPSRPVVSNDGWEHVDSDILTLHDYSTEPTILRERYADRHALAETLSGMGPQDREPILSGVLQAQVDEHEIPIMVTEFGGVAYSADGTWGYAIVTSDSAFRHRIAELFGALEASPVLSGFCYTQLTDTMQESNGLLTEQREPKLAIEVLRAIVTGTDVPTVVEVAERRVASS